MSKLITEQIIRYQPDLVIMYDGWNDLRANYSAETVYTNWKSVCEFGHENKFDVIIALQPIAGFGNKELTQQEYVNSITGKDHNGLQLLLQKNQYEEYATNLKDLSTVCTVTKDLRDVFDQVKGSVFWDQGHIAEAGNMIIGEKLYEISLSTIQNPNLKNHSIFNEILKKYNNSNIISYLLEQYDIDTTNFKDVEPSYNIEAGKYFSLKDKFGVNNILVGKDLSNTVLSTINLVTQDLTGANLSGQDLRNIDLTGTILLNVNLTNTNLSGLDLRNRDLTGSIFNETNLYETKFENVICKYCDISNTNFSNAIVSSSILTYSTITDSDFSNLRLIAMVFNNSDISNTDFSNSDLSFSKQPGYIPYQIKIELAKFGMSADEVKKLNYWKFSNMSNKILYNHTGTIPVLALTNWSVESETVSLIYMVVNSFADSNLSNLNFVDSNLFTVNFSGATDGNTIGNPLVFDNVMFAGANLDLTDQDLFINAFDPDCNIWRCEY